MFENRYTRQESIVPQDQLSGKIVTVIGCGAIGRQAAIQLAAIGIKRLKLIDFDTVEQENLASQAFFESDIGRKKVEAVRDLCKKINSECEIVPYADKFDPSMFSIGVIFCCVDKIRTRKEIFEAVATQSELFLDTRMAGEYIRILSCFDEPSRNHYAEKALFDEREAFAGSCTAKTTIFCANIAAGLMVSNFTKWLRNISIEKDIKLNLLTNEMLLG